MGEIAFSRIIFALPVVFTSPTHLLLTAADSQSLYTWNSCLLAAVITHRVQHALLQQFSFIWANCVWELRWRGKVDSQVWFGHWCCCGWAEFFGKAGYWCCQLQPRSEVPAHLITTLALQRGEAVSNMNNTDDATRRLNRFLRPLFLCFLDQECFTKPTIVTIAVRNKPWTTLMLFPQTSSRLM